jgi:hypothetical protein
MTSAGLCRPSNTLAKVPRCHIRSPMRYAPTVQVRKIRRRACFSHTGSRSSSNWRACAGFWITSSLRNSSCTPLPSDSPMRTMIPATCHLRKSFTLVKNHIHRPPPGRVEQFGASVVGFTSHRASPRGSVMRRRGGSASGVPRDLRGHHVHRQMHRRGCRVVRTVASCNVALCCIHLQSLAAQGFGDDCALRPIAFSGAELHVFRP